MKRVFLLLLLVCVAFSCSKKEENAKVAVCTIKGRYASAPDGTVLYMTPLDDIQAPVDSAVVRGGRFCFELADSTVAVRFISSQVVLDGNFVMISPGVINVDFDGDVFASGTPANERLSRFMSEKYKIVNLRRMAAPDILDEMAVDAAVCDSVKELASFASDIFEAYAIREIQDNLQNPLGYFYLLQSVGVVPSAKLLPMLDRVSFECRDKLYDVIKRRLEADIRDAEMAEKYLEDVRISLEATGVGKKFQNFELNNISGGKVLLFDEVFANKYTILFFWAGWENGVKSHLAKLANAYDKHRGEGLQIVGVSLDGSVEECKALCDEVSVGWVQLCNPAGGSAEVAAAYGVVELPAAVLINSKGTIIARMATVDEVLKKINELF